MPGTNRHKMLLVVLTVVVAHMLSLSTASAARLSLSGNRVDFVWHKLTIEPNTIECNVTLSGSFESSVITKREESQIGVIDEAEFTNCANAEVEALAIEEEPWILEFGGFTGELPDINSVRLLLLNMNVSIFISSWSTLCLLHTEEGAPAAGEAILNGEGTVTAFRVDGTLEIPLTGGFLCAFAASALEGTGTVEDGESGPVVVSLV